MKEYQDYPNYPLAEAKAEYSHWVRGEFLIPDSGKVSTPMCELDYWEWLKTNGFGHAIEDKKNYLKSLGFIRGIDFLSSDDIKILHATEDHFFYLKYKKN